MLRKCIGIAKSMGMAAIVISLFTASQDLIAQNLSPGNVTHYEVKESSKALTMIASTSQVLTFDHDIPYVVVGNQEILKASPVSPNQILVTAVKPGITAVPVKDPDDKNTTIEIQVIGDVRELQRTLNRHFANSAIHAEALQTSVILSGHVTKSEHVARAVEVSQQFFPTVINHMTVLGSQKVMLKVKIVEVSRTKLRKLGIDWAALTDNFNLVSNFSGLINAAGTGGIGTVRANILDNADQYTILIDTLEQNNLAKILAEPVVTAMSGRSAAFLSGGEAPVPINTGLGVQSVSYQPFGTKVDFVPYVLGEGRIRLEVRPEVRELAGDLRDPVTGAPGFRTRRVDTGVEMQVGQTLALAGLIQNRVDSVERGAPILKDLPFIGGAFRRVEETFNEVELVILITPHFVNEVDGSILPDGPGRNTVSPTDRDFYRDGYVEVPSCGDPYEYGPINSSLENAGPVHNLNQGLEYGRQGVPTPSVPTQPQQVGPTQEIAPVSKSASPGSNVAPASYAPKEESQEVAPRQSLKPSAQAQPAPTSTSVNDLRYFPRPRSFGK